MANGTIEFFASACPLSFTGWELQSEGPRSTEVNYTNELKADGDELANASTGTKTTGSWVFVSTVAPGTNATLTIPNVGQIASGGWHLDEVSISWDRQQMKPKMTVTAHVHSGTGHTAGSCRQYAASVSIPAVAFGVPADLGGVSLADGAVVDFASATYKLTCNHIDEPGRAGAFLAGDNHDGVETLEVNFTGNVTSDDYVVATGWKFNTRSFTRSNTAATTSSIALVHHIAHVVPQTSVSMASPMSTAPDAAEPGGDDSER